MRLANITTDANGAFPLADLFAIVEAETDSSICFHLGHFTDHPKSLPPDAVGLFDSGGSNDFFFEILGWIDVHYPCKGRRKVLIRLNLPSEYHARERTDTIIETLLSLLSIPMDAFRVTVVFSAVYGVCILPNDEFHGG
jgi:hypothetical protein